MKKVISAAKVENERLQEMLDSIDDDFSFITQAISKLDRIGSANRAMEILSDLNNSFQTAISDISEELQNRG